MDKTNSNDRQGKRGVSRTMIFLLSLLLTAGLAVAGDESVVSSGKLVRSVGSTAQIQNAQPRMPILDNPSQIPLPAGVQAGDVGTMAYGTAGHPYTTKLASVNRNNKNVFMAVGSYRPTGKLWTRFGADWFVCTGSVIKPGIVVTAAHCVSDFGTGVFADEIIFEPARFGTQVPYGDWTATEIYVPNVYLLGTDECDVAGVVCENDIAVVVMTQNGSGQYPGDVVGQYAYWDINGPYVSFAGMMAAQITQMGYPTAFESGDKMIRTDSLGYQASPNNLIIGSEQTGGSSGGPWIMNFGMPPSTTVSNPSFGAQNRVVAVTSWGYISDTVKVQGASRFGKNTTFTSKSNIQALVDAACTDYPDRC